MSPFLLGVRCQGKFHNERWYLQLSVRRVYPSRKQSLVQMYLPHKIHGLRCRCRCLRAILWVALLIRFLLCNKGEAAVLLVVAQEQLAQALAEHLELALEQLAVPLVVPL